MRTLLSLLCVMMGGASIGQAVTTLATFNMKSLYGVNSPEQQIAFAYNGGQVSKSNNSVLGPDSAQVAYQQLSDGRIVLSAPLPDNTPKISYTATGSSNINTSDNSITFGINSNVWPPVNTPVKVSGSNLASCGLSAGTYYVAANIFIAGVRHSIAFKSTLGGSTITLTNSGCDPITIETTGFTVNSNTFTVPNNHYFNGMPYKCKGPAFPVELTCDGSTLEGYVINATTNTFQISTSVGGSFKPVSNLSSGLNYNVIDYDYTLVSGTASTAAPASPLIVDTSDPATVTISTGLIQAKLLRKMTISHIFTNITVVLSSSGTVGTVDTIADHHFTAGVTKVSISGSQGATPGVVGPGGVVTIATTPTSHTFTYTSPSSTRIDGTYTGNTIIDPPQNIAPLQSMTMPNGEVINNNPLTNLLYMSCYYPDGVKLGSAAQQTCPNSHITSFVSAFVEKGPLRVVYQATYATNRPKYTYDGTKYLTNSTAGVGSITFKFTFFAGQRDFLFQYSGDDNFAGWIDTYTGLSVKPDTHTWRTGGTPGVQEGATSYQTSGYYGPLAITGVGPSGHTNPCQITSIEHGLVNANQTHAFISGVGGKTAANVSDGAISVEDNDHFTLTGVDCSSGTYTAATGVFKGYIDSAHSTDTTFTEDLAFAGSILPSSGGYSQNSRRGVLTSWPNNAGTSGHNQCLFNLNGASNTPVVCFYTGRASLAFSTQFADAGIYTTTAGIQSGATEAGFYYQLMPCVDCTADPPIFLSNVSREVGVILSNTKSDLAALNPKDPRTVVQRLQNVTAGINLTHLLGCPIAPCTSNGYGLTFPDPSGGWGNAFMADAKLGAIRTAYQNNTPPAGVTAKIFASSGENARSTILTLWSGNSAASVDAIILAGAINLLYVDDTFTYADGIFANEIASANLVSDTLGPYSSTLITTLADPNKTSDQNLQLKSIIGFYGPLALDQDFLPTNSDYAGTLTGSGIIFDQDQQIRDSQNKLITLFPTQPVLALHQASLLAATQTSLVNSVNPYGSVYLIPGYFGAADPLITTIMAQKNLNGLNPNTSFPLLANFFNFLNDMLTPPEIRFSTTARKYPVIGDTASGGGTAEVGLGAALYDTVDTPLSQRSIAAFDTMAPTVPTPLYPFIDYFVPGVIGTDLNVTPATLNRGNINYPGYASNHRFNYGTANENMVTSIGNGNWVTSGGHFLPSQGMTVSKYFFKVMHSSNIFPYFHQPRNDSRFMQSGNVVLDSELSQAYNADNPSLSNPGPWGVGQTSQTEFAAFDNSSYSCQQSIKTTDSTIWKNCMLLTNGNAAYPLLVTTNTFPSGPSAAVTKTWSQFVHWDRGPITLPDASTLTPTVRGTTCYSDTASEFASGGASTALSTGLQHFLFNGPNYPSLGGGGYGISTDNWLILNSGAHYTLNSWGLRGVPGAACTTQGAAYSAANKLTASAGVAASSTTLTLTLGTTYTWKVGDTGVIASCAGMGTPPTTTAVTAVSGNDVTFNGGASLTGSYTGCTASPDFIEIQAILRTNTDGPTFNLEGPYLKDAPPSRTASLVAGGVQVVTTSPVSTTEFFEITSNLVSAYTFTDGTKQCLESYDTGTHSAFSMTIAGGPQEVCKLSSSSYTWKVTGETAGLRTFTPPTTLYANKPVLWTGSAFQLYHPGGEQPTPYAITLSTTSGIRRTVNLAFNNTNADQVRVRFDSTTDYTGSATCSTTCAMLILSPQGPKSYSWEYLNSGVVIGRSDASTITVQ